MTKTYSHKFKYLFFLIPISFILVSGCDILGSSDSCRKLDREPIIIKEVEMFRYISKFTIEFISEWSHQQSEEFLIELGYPYETIWQNRFVVYTGCGNSAEKYYTNYGTNQRLSLGDSTFVQFINPVYNFPEGHTEGGAKYYLTGNIYVKFDKDTSIERIVEIAEENNLEFRNNDPGAPLGIYIFIVPKEACCNALQLEPILKLYEEIDLVEAMFTFTVPPPDD